MNSTHKSAAKVGVFGIGLEAYWAQFAGLRERLEGYQRYVEEQIGRWATIASSGLVDTAPKAQVAGKRFAEERVDLIFCHVGTYATSSQVLPAVQEAKAPVVLLNLQPVAALDYENTDTGEWLANCSACCVPEISCTSKWACLKRWRVYWIWSSWKLTGAPQEDEHRVYGRGWKYAPPIYFPQLLCQE